MCISRIRKRSHEEISNQSSYTSALTSKIMSNLSIRCENVILKLVEEDIVFSMNIEKLTFDNVNENWIQSMTGRWSSVSQTMMND